MSDILNHEKDQSDAPLDGGPGWLVVAGSFLCQWVIFGYNFTWGIYEDYYYREVFQEKVSISALALVGTVGTALIVVLGPINGPLIDRFGYRKLVGLGSILLPLGILLASFATELWHLFLTQGVLYGIGASFVFFPSVGIIAEWFSKKRGLASGIAVSGTGVGGLVLGPLTHKLIDIVNVAWTLRIIAIHAFVFLVIATFLIRGRIERPHRPFQLDFSLLKDNRFVVLLATTFVEYFAYVIPFFLTPEYCVYIGLGSSTGGLFVGLMSGANAVGRIVFGFIADKYGNTITMTCCTFLAGISILVLWSFSQGYALMCVFVLAYGFFGGGFVSLLPVVTAQVTGVQKLGNALGLVFATTIVGNLVGTPITTALKGTAGEGRMTYIPAILFSGFITLSAACCLFTLHRMSIPTRA
ncbi:hypothetical protein K7432_013998 [Basidiobolus ranarum]|uniref:Major facilitator superfamily (MFS) profile domain-containing protein n=1 Tax=Basidiobolus ranarum TaxID=34480 RepID=A0ABR2VQ84_9FUNG